MTLQYEGEEPCCRCIHKNVCGAKSCLNEIQYSTTHPYFNIDVKCTEFYNSGRYHTCERCKYGDMLDDNYPCNQCIHEFDNREDFWELAESYKEDEE